jgi:chromosome segregation ATPase
MAKPLPATGARRNGALGALLHSPSNGAVQEVEKPDAGLIDYSDDVPAACDDAELLRAENEQLRALCTELEQALQEASQQGDPNYEDRIREYDALLDEKSETIRGLHQQLQDAQAMIAELEADRGNKPKVTGPTPREEELLNLSEELESERRQLQEDEQSLMGQMRDMEMTMAKERAEMARQRNDLQRIQSEVRHELERLERNGALQSKIDGLKSKLHDATTRRGMATTGAAPAAPPQKAPPAQPQQAPEAPKRDASIFGRFFGGGK